MNELTFQLKDVSVRIHLKRIAGIDIVAVYGISASLAQTIIAEIGTDMTKFPSEKHFCSRTLKTHNRTGRLSDRPRPRSSGQIAPSGHSTAASRAASALLRQWWQLPTRTCPERSEGLRRLCTIC